MQPADELRDAVETYLGALSFAPELGDWTRHCATPSSRAASAFVRCCASRSPRRPARRRGCAPGGGALELVHTFSLVHDDLPALDDDDERRGRPSAHIEFGEGVALLAGDALLAEAVRLALTYEENEVARELVGRDARDDRRPAPRRHRRRRGPRSAPSAEDGRLFVAAVRMGLEVAGVPEAERAPWLAFGDEVGLLFQVVDDILDGDGYVERLGHDGATARGRGAGARAHASRRARADTSVLRELVESLAVRTA